MAPNYQTFKLSAVSTTRGVVPIKFGVYLITCLPTGQIYVGSTAGRGGLRYRISRHLSYLRSGKHVSSKLQSAFNTYGEDAFYCCLLEEVPDPKGCKSCEQKYLDDLSPFGEKGFNKLPKSQSRLGVKHTVEARSKMSKARTGRSKSWNRWYLKRVSESSRAKWRNPETRAAIIAGNVREFSFEKDGKIVRGKNVVEFAKQHGLRASHLYSVLAGRLKHHHGWKHVIV